MAKCCCFFSLRTGCYLAASYCIFFNVIMIIRFAIMEKNVVQQVAQMTKMFNPDNNPLAALNMLNTKSVGGIDINSLGGTTGPSPSKLQQLLASFPQGGGREGEGATLAPSTPFPLALAPEGKLPANVLLPSQGESPFSRILEKLDSFQKILFALWYVIFAGWLLTALMFVVALRHNCLRLMLPWLFYTIFFTGVLLVGFVGVAAISVSKIIPPQFMSTQVVVIEVIVDMFLLFVNVYTCWCVWTYYMQLRTEDKIAPSFMELGAYTDEPDQKPILQEKEDYDKFEI